MSDSINGVYKTILNEDGSQIAVPVEEIYEMARKILLHQQIEINKLLGSYGMKAGISTDNISDDHILVTNIIISVDKHNEKVVRSLVSKHNEKSVQEFKLLSDLAKLVHVKIVMDNNDWNKLALEVSKKERESHSVGSFE